MKNKRYLFDNWSINIIGSEKGAQVWVVGECGFSGQETTSLRTASPNAEVFRVKGTNPFPNARNQTLSFQRGEKWK